MNPTQKRKIIIILQVLLETCHEVDVGGWRDDAIRSSMIPYAASTGTVFMSELECYRTNLSVYSEFHLGTESSSIQDNHRHRKSSNLLTWKYNKIQFVNHSASNIEGDSLAGDGTAMDPGVRCVGCVSLLCKDVFLERLYNVCTITEQEADGQICIYDNS